jgi:hypothetical protein
MASGGRRHFALLDLQILGLVVIQALTASLFARKCQVFSLAFPVAVPQWRRSVSCRVAVVAQASGVVLAPFGGGGSSHRGLEATAGSMLRTMTDVFRDIWRRRKSWTDGRKSNRRARKWSNRRSHSRYGGDVTRAASCSEGSLCTMTPVMSDRCRRHDAWNHGLHCISRHGRWRQLRSHRRN